MPAAGRDGRNDESEGTEEPPVEVIIVSQGDSATPWLVGEPEVQPESGPDRLTRAATEAAVAITDARKASGYDQDQPSAGGTSLWWPDRTAQVVQATFVKPHVVGDFLLSRVGRPHERLRISNVASRSPNHFSANAQLRVRRAGWRSVTLRIYPTPSGNLTVIEMMPRRAWMPQTERYLAAGVPAITELTNQLDPFM